VLLVEDHETSAAGYAELLTGAGYRVARAGNGYEALAEVSRETPSIILLDLKLPKLDGWDLLQRLKADASSLRADHCRHRRCASHASRDGSIAGAVRYVEANRPGELLTVVRCPLRPSLH
jgi:CheY-like chemotaxis protein